MGYAIVADGLGKVYSKDHAIKDVSFKVEEGEIFGFLGPNGAGKTTTLRIVCGILDQTDGKCTVGGFDTRDDKIKVKETVGYLPEEDFLYGEMTVKDHIEYIAELYGVKDISSKLVQALRLVDMEAHVNDVIKTLSKGQRRRVAIAKTLIHDPKIVLLDEVTSGLDPIYARRMVDVVRQLKKQGKTIVFSTHLLDEATKLCDHILVINKGHVLAYGTTDEVIRQTKTGSLEDAFFKLIGSTVD